MSPRRSADLTVEHVLLALLLPKPLHGYELYQELCELQGISLVWNIKQALLYAILDKLEDMGYLTSQLVQGETYPARKYFTLTELGNTSLRAWTLAPVRRARDFRQEFLAKLIVARRFGKATADELLQNQQAACQNWAAELQATLPDPSPEQMDEWLVYSYRIARLEALLKWLRQAAQALDTISD
jgi:DNA-binding PadR family transcriptional regulator